MSILAPLLNLFRHKHKWCLAAFGSGPNPHCFSYDKEEKKIVKSDWRVNLECECGARAYVRVKDSITSMYEVSTATVIPKP